MRQIGTVARAAGLIWIAELAGAFEISRRRVVIGLVAVGMSALALGTALGLTTISTLSHEVPEEVAGLMIETATSGSLLSTALVSVILGLAAPARSSLDHLLCLLPVTSSARSIGTSIPATAISALGSLALSMPAMLLANRVLDGGETSRYMLALLTSMSVVLTLTQNVLRITAIACRRLLRVPAAVASTISGAVTIGAALLAFGHGVISPVTPRAAPALTLPGLAAELALAPNAALAWLVLAAVPAAAAVVVWACNKVPDVKSSPPGRAFLPTSRLVGGASGAFFAHLLIMIRAPQTVLAMVGAVCFLASVTWAFPPSLPLDVRNGLAAAVPAAGCALVLFAPGRVLPLGWLGPPLGRNRGWWVTPTALTHAGVAGIAWAALALGALVVGVIRAEELSGMALRGALVFSAAALAGALVPWSEAQPLSGSVALVTASVLSFAAGGLIMRISETSGQLGRLVSVLITLMFFAASVLAIQRLTRSR